MIASNLVRVERLASELRETGFDAFLGWSPVTLGYLHGFREGAAERFMTLGIRSSGECRLIAPALSASQASRAGIADIRSWSDGEDPLSQFVALGADWDLRSALIAVDDEMPAHMLLAIQSALPAALFKPGGSLMASLMRRKDAAELASMREAASIADEATAAGLAALREGCTEAHVADALAAEMKRLGGHPAFSIVAFGSNSAEPHHHGNHTTLKRGDVVVLDFGCEVDGYHSDITRTVCFGSAPDEARTLYEVVFRSHMAGRGAIHPGVAAEEVDRVARAVIADSGYGEFFIHRLGHGIGSRVHEEPNLVKGNSHKLEVGNCCSVEPGIYLPGRFGVRIENIVTVTEGGHESLNTDPPPTMIEVG